MTDAWRVRAVLAGLLTVAAAVFFTGIGWGLPTRANDRFLFGSADRAWDGARIAEAGGGWKPDLNRAADADADPIADRSKVVWLNETPRQQAEILRRYRLFSHQPDEMVTFMALAGMRGGRYDPRMYQYGGLWIYPVGGLLKIAGRLGLVDVRSDLTYYLDHPEAFGRFYVVARAYSAMWGVVGVWAVFALMRRFSTKLLLPATAAACFAVMPAGVN